MTTLPCCSGLYITSEFGDGHASLLFFGSDSAPRMADGAITISSPSFMTHFDGRSGHENNYKLLWHRTQTEVYGFNAVLKFPFAVFQSRVLCTVRTRAMLWRHASASPRQALLLRCVAERAIGHTCVVARMAVVHTSMQSFRCNVDGTQESSPLPLLRKEAFVWPCLTCVILSFSCIAFFLVPFLGNQSPSHPVNLSAEKYDH